MAKNLREAPLMVVEAIIVRFIHPTDINDDIAGAQHSWVT
jgi:hypothetical protein